MIIKAIGVRSRFGGCLRYLLDKPREVEPEILATTFPGADATVMAEHAAFDASRRPDIAKPCYHAVIAWDEADRPTDAEMHDVANKLLHELRIDTDSHGYAIIAHRDTPHAHCHLVVNRVSDTGKVWDRHGDAALMQTFRRQMENDYDLVRAEGRGTVRQIAGTLAHGETATPRSLKGAKHEVHAAVASAIKHCDGTFAGFIATCKTEGKIFPALSFNAQGGFNGASFTLLEVDGSAAMAPVDPTTGGEQKPFIFKGSEIKWTKSTFEAALLARREQLAHPGGSATLSPDGAAQAGHDLHASLTRQRRDARASHERPPAPIAAGPVTAPGTYRRVPMPRVPMPRRSRPVPFYPRLFRRGPGIRRWRTQVNWGQMFGTAAQMDTILNREIAIVASGYDLEHPLPKTPWRFPRR